MKNIILLFLLISQNLFSQTNFFQTGATWGYHTIEKGDTPWDTHRDWLDQITITGDTAINGMSYKKLETHTQYSIIYPQNSTLNTVGYYFSFGQYLRYDSLTFKVYVYRDFDSTVSLMYDYNLSLGDTVPSLYHFKIDSVENISLFGFTTRKFYISPDSSYGSSVMIDYIIEGMGSSIGLTTLDPYMLTVSSETYTELICFQLGNDVYPSGSVCDLSIGINENNDVNTAFHIFPNPTTGRFTFSLSDYSPVTEITITSAFGQELSRTRYSNTSKVELEIKGNGDLYFVRVVAGDKSGVYKIVKM